MTTDIDLNRAEHTLLLSLGAAIVARAGRIAAEARYPDVTSEDLGAITIAVENFLTDIIIGLRAPGPHATLAEIAQVTQEVAMGAVVKILGEPPPTTGTLH